MYKVKHSLVPDHIYNNFYKQDKHYTLWSADFSILGFHPRRKGETQMETF